MEGLLDHLGCEMPDEPVDGDHPRTGLIPVAPLLAPAKTFVDMRRVGADGHLQEVTSFLSVAFGSEQLIASLPRMVAIW